MSDSFRNATGRKVVSRASAHDLGVVAHLLVDAERRAVAALVIGTGKKAQLVDWEQISGFGPDAIMISDDGALRGPADGRERLAAEGRLELIGKRALSDTGNELGAIDDVSFDPDTGALDTFRVAGHEIPAGALLGSGSYAAILDANQSGTTG